MFTNVHRACLDHRSLLQRLAGLAGLDRRVPWENEKTSAVLRARIPLEDLPNMITKYCVYALLAASACAASAMEQDAAIVFAPAIRNFENTLFKDKDCEGVLQRSWYMFSGSYNYEAVEKRYMQGAGTATMCGIRRGYVLYLLLGELEKQRKAGALKRGGFEAAVAAAQKSFYDMPMETYEQFFRSVDCHITTPRITFSGQFSNTVNVSCSTNRGPAVVDLHTLRISVGGKSAWNGGDNTYFGRSIAGALGQDQSARGAQTGSKVAAPPRPRAANCRNEVVRTERQMRSEEVCDYNSYGPVNCRQVPTWVDAPVTERVCD